MNNARSAGRPGMTLLEMLMALLVFTVVLAGAMSFIIANNQAFSAGIARLGMVQNYRFAANALETDLATVGTGIVAGQPFLVYADTNVISFNADYASRLENDIFAVYRDPDLPDAAVGALTPDRAISFPSGFTYPDSAYRIGTSNSPAETITFFFAPDTTTPRTDDFVLMRQVNDLAPEVVSRNLLRAPGRPFFEYQRIVAPENADPYVAAVPVGQLPLAHTIALHGSPADTGAAALIDNVRGVRVSFTTFATTPDGTEQRRTVHRLIRFPNAGLSSLNICGERPLLGTSLALNVVTLASGEPGIELAWNAATDETGGEQDVIRYVIFRGVQPNPDAGDPYLSIPAGLNSYVYVDGGVTPGVTYYYALAAQDCTPSLSEVTRAQITVH